MPTYPSQKTIQAPWLLFIGVLALACAAWFAQPEFFLAPALLVAGVCVPTVWRRPELTLAVVLLMVPFETLQQLSFSKFLTLSKLAGAAGIVLVGYRLLTGRADYRRLRTRMWWLIALLLGVHLVGSVGSIAPEMSIEHTRKLFIAVAVFGLGLVLIPRLPARRWVEMAFFSVAATAALSLAGPGEADVQSRNLGFLTDANYFAMLLVSSVPLGLYLLRTAPRPLYGAVVAVSLVFLLIATVQSFSRSAFVVFMLLVAFWLWGERHRVRRMPASSIGLAGAFGLVVMLGAVAVAPTEYVQRVTSLAQLVEGTQGLEDRSLGRRSSYLVVGLEATANRPVFGSGPGTYPVLYSRSPFAVGFSLSDGPDSLFRRAHNTYLELMVEVGLPGAFAFVALVVYGTVNFRRARAIWLHLGQWELAELARHCGLAFMSIALFLFLLSAPNLKWFWFFLAFSHVMLAAAERYGAPIAPYWDGAPRN